MNAGAIKNRYVRIDRCAEFAGKFYVTQSTGFGMEWPNLLDYQGVLIYLGKLKCDYTLIDRTGLFAEVAL